MLFCFMIKKNILLLLMTVCSIAAFGQSKSNESYPFGVWTGGNVTPDIADLVRGRMVACHWRDLEPQKGQWNWEVIAPRIMQAASAGKCIGMIVYVGPDSPDWIYEHGVPKVTTPDKVNVRGGSHKARFPYYPYYLDANYRNFWFNEIRTTADWVAALPKNVREKITFVQTAEGTTGDEGPYKGVPYEEKYRISNEGGTGEEWVNLKKDAWRIFRDKYTTMNPPIRLLINSGNQQQYEAILDTLVPDAWKKSGHPGHIYQYNGEKTYIKNKKDDIWNRCSNGEFRRFRSEMDETENGWFKENYIQNMYWLCTYDLYYGLDMLLLSGRLIADPKYRVSLEFYNKYAGQKDPAEAIGAFSAMKDVLDAADTERFPESIYGKANDTNKERFAAIAKDYEVFGARNGDIDHAIGGTMRNRQSKAMNDVGFDLVPGNYELFLTQIDANATSQGWWNVGPKDQPYGRFARSFDVENNKNQMFFVLNKDFFTKNPDKTVNIRVVYLDEGHGKWSLNYVDKKGKIKEAVKISNKNSGRWKEAVVTISDAVFTANGPKGSDLILSNESRENTKFHMVELTRKNL
jgi:hypothetical protein